MNVALQCLKGEFKLTEPKTQGSRRSIPLDPKLIKQLKKHKARQAEERLLAGPEWEDWGLVFTTRKRRPLEGPRITRDFKSLLRDAGLPEQRFHDLRHACATFMLAQGDSPHEVKEWLGHSQVSLTLNTYAHVLPNVKKESAERLGKLLG